MSPIFTFISGIIRSLWGNNEQRSQRVTCSGDEGRKRRLETETLLLFPVGRCLALKVEGIDENQKGVTGIASILLPSVVPSQSAAGQGAAFLIMAKTAS